MITCSDFIPAYNELFIFLHVRGGEAAVQEFWDWYSDNALVWIRQLVKEHGIRGCWIHWTHTLSEETADCTLELDEDAGKFQITMHACPSKGRLLQFNKEFGYRLYPDYCKHCEVIWRRAIERGELSYKIDLSKVDKAQCRIVVRTKRKSEKK